PVPPKQNLDPSLRLRRRPRASKEERASHEACHEHPPPESGGSLEEDLGGGFKCREHLRSDQGRPERPPPRPSSSDRPHAQTPQVHGKRARDSTLATCSVDLITKQSCRASRSRSEIRPR